MIEKLFLTCIVTQGVLKTRLGEGAVYELRGVLYTVRFKDGVPVSYFRVERGQKVVHIRD